MLYLKIIEGAFAQAIQQLLGNKLRSFLSLLGITIGIFCIIGVKSAINSLEDNIKGSFEKLGNDVIYLSKMPWGEDPGQNYWKYQRRPQPSIEDLEAIQAKVRTADKAAFTVFLGSKIAKFNSNSVENIVALGVTFDYVEIFKLKFEKGRFLTPTEYSNGKDLIVIGNTVAEQLFGALDPIGKDIIFFGHKMKVVGVIEKSGRDLFNPINFDECILLSYECARKVANVKPKFGPFGTSLNVKAADGVSVEQLKDDVTGVLRGIHRLKPREDNDFSLNEMSILTALLDNIFVALNLMGIIIGGFALIVGMFSVANIMFVSVKERTNIIGIKKAIGAKSSVILLEFLIESIILCIIGGILGLLLIFGIAALLTLVLPFDIYLSWQNAATGVIASVLVGIIAGMIPAIQASKMDPVEAIRQ
jgi:putative ABC transport system permease protein